MAKNFFTLTPAILGLIFLGCTDDGPLARISGEVLIDGQPAATGSISFFPDEGQPAPTTGAEIKNGKYDSDVPIGKTKVEIRVPRKTGSRKLYNTPDSPIQDTFEESLPAKYNTQTELKFTAQRGSNKQDWDLSVAGK